MNLIDTQVWKLFISPNDRTLQSSYNLTIEGFNVPVRLFETEILNKKQNKNFVNKKYRSKYYLAQGPQASQDIQKRKLLVIFPGRNFNFFQQSNIKYFERFYKTNKLFNYDMAIIIYPHKTTSIDSLSKSCELALRQIIQHGYKIKNVSIMGWCLGGYFATETLKSLVESNYFSNSDDKFNCFINNKSFSCINDFLYCIMPKYTRPLLKFYPIKREVQVWNNDSAESLKKFEPNFENVYVIYTDNDTIVNGFSHLYKHLKDVYHLINIIEDRDRLNHLPNWDLMADIFTQN